MLKSWTESDSELFLYLNAAKSADIHLYPTHLKVYWDNKSFHVLFLRPIIVESMLKTVEKNNIVLRIEKADFGKWDALEPPNKKQLWATVVESEIYKITFTKHDKDVQQALIIKKAMDCDLDKIPCEKTIIAGFDLEQQLKIINDKIELLLHPLKDIPVRSYFKLNQ